MTLIRIWSKARGVVYDKDGSSKEKTPGVVKDNVIVELDEQLAFAF